jgi:hypothetical protein
MFCYEYTRDKNQFLGYEGIKIFIFFRALAPLGERVGSEVKVIIEIMSIPFSPFTFLRVFPRNYTKISKRAVSVSNSIHDISLSGNNRINSHI